MTELMSITVRVRATFDEILRALSYLADELSVANSPRWDETPDVAGAARQVLTVSVAFAMALVDLLPDLELEYTDLDVVLGSIARSRPDLESSNEIGELFTKLFRALREISYDAPRLDSFPDVEGCSSRLETFITELLDSAHAP